MRPVERGATPLDEHGAAIVFGNYQDAQDHLLGRIGNYCSYCGMRLDTSPHVEHVRPKLRHEALRCAWENFLIACPHCNSTKHDADVILEDYCWPDTDNPMALIEYGPRAFVRPMPGLAPDQDARARRTIELVGLDRVPGSERPPRDRDRRWRMRHRAWDEACESLELLRGNDTPQMREQIVKTAICDGYWSVWYAAFACDPDLRWRLIRAARGTCQTCWDESGAPMQR